MSDQTPKGTVEDKPKDNKAAEQPNPKPDGTDGQGEKPDYEEKFKHSTSENQRLIGVNKVLEERIKGFTDTTEPTEDECQKHFKTWDMMSETEREVAKSQLHIKKRQDAADMRDRLKQEASAWESKLVELAKANPDLNGREAEFVKFCYERDPHAASDVSLLADAFLHKYGAKPTVETPPAPGNLESGSAGPKAPAPPGKKKYTASEVKAIREADPKRYQSMIRSGELKPSDL